MSKYKILHKNKDIALYLVYTVIAENRIQKKGKCLYGKQYTPFANNLQLPSADWYM